MEDRNLPDKLMWTEPAAYRRSRFQKIEHAQPAKPLLFACFVFLALIVVRFMAGLSPQPGHNPPGWPMVIPVCLAVAVFSAYVLPRIAGQLTKYIAILSDKGVNLNSTGFQTKFRFYPWDSIGHCQFATEALGDVTFEVVNLFDKDGNWIRDLALNGNRDEVRRYIASRGIRIE